MTLRVLWRVLAQALVSADIDDGDLEARLILEAVTQRTFSQMMRDLSEPVSMIHVKQAQKYAKHRVMGMPLGYVLGHWDFMAHRYAVGPGVLIPRPETEGLVHTVIAAVRAQGWEQQSLTILELGVGSGVLSIELALALPQARVIGWEKSRRAARIAVQNATALGADIEVVSGDFFAKTAAWRGELAPQTRRAGPVILVSNPPYVTDGEWQGLEAHVRDFEPRAALVGGMDGLDFYRRVILAVSRLHKIPMFFEIGMSQGGAVVALGAQEGYQGVIHPDLNGRPRIVTLRPND